MNYEECKEQATPDSVGSLIKLTAELAVEAVATCRANGNGQEESVNMPIGCKHKFYKWLFIAGLANKAR